MQCHSQLTKVLEKPNTTEHSKIFQCNSICILGDPGADSEDEEKSKRAEKYMA